MFIGTLALLFEIKMAYMNPEGWGDRSYEGISAIFSVDFHSGSYQIPGLSWKAN